MKGNWMVENTQHISVRVYYEDTDLSGRVYHPSYLRFLERGRTEWLRAYGLQHSDLAISQEVTFAVVRVLVDFVAPAAIDDLLTVATTVEELSGPIIRFQQTILRGDRLIATGQVDVVTLRGNRPVKPPKLLLEVIAVVKRRSRDRYAR